MSQSRVVSKALASGFVFDAKAFDLMSKLPPGFDVDGLLESVLEQKRNVTADVRTITEDDLQRLLPPDAAPDMCSALRRTS